jgi:hypothetical protein
VIAARLALVLVVLALAAPAAALAQDAFGPLPASPPDTSQQQVVTTSSSSTDDDGGLKSWQEILIFVAGGFLLVGIGWAIVSDARRSAPVEETAGVHAAKTAREADRHKRKEVARQRGRAARAARKRNR